MASLEAINVDKRDIACDGEGGVLGHPRVFLHIDNNTNKIYCSYCSRLYVLAEGAGESSH